MFKFETIINENNKSLSSLNNNKTDSIPSKHYIKSTTASNARNRNKFLQFFENKFKLRRSASENTINMETTNEKEINITNPSRSHLALNEII